MTAQPGLSSSTNVDWEFPLGVVAGHVLVQAAVSYTISHSIAAAILPDWIGLFSWTQTVATAGASLGLWLVHVGFVNIFALIWDGKGEFRPLLFKWGYGYLPQVVSGIVTLFVLTNVLPGLAQLISEYEIESIRRIANDALGWIAAMNSGAQVLGSIWGVWCVRRIHQLSWMKSAVVALSPFVFMALLGLLSRN